ncbi:MAG: hypothetical protein AAGF66_14730 [Cyanobacteria bacterium P01_H01_bin.119]
MTRYAVLVGEINRDLADLERLVEQTQALMSKVQSTGDEDYLGTVALNLHGFYAGVERIFRDVALTVDGSLPDGADWHRRLLRQMAAVVPEIRPAVVSSTTLQKLTELCAFRHVVRNVYTFDLIPNRIEALAHELPKCLTHLQVDLQRFCEFLMTVNGAVQA